MVLKALDIGPGDEVITAANTFVATVGAINELGAIPVFVDCDDTFCMNVDLVEEKITERTKALLPVHFTGYMVDMPKLIEISALAKKELDIFDNSDLKEALKLALDFNLVRIS